LKCCSEVSEDKAALMDDPIPTFRGSIVSSSWTAETSFLYDISVLEDKDITLPLDTLAGIRLPTEAAPYCRTN